jgi:hypothetical protein
VYLRTHVGEANVSKMSDPSEPGWGGYPQQWPPPAPQDQPPPPPPPSPPGRDPYTASYDAYTAPEWGMPQYAYRGPRVAERTSGLAIGAFVVSIASWVLLGLIPLIGAIAALVMAGIAHGEIRRSQGRVGGMWAVTATYVIAGVQLAGAVLVFGLLALLFSGGFRFG